MFTGREFDHAAGSQAHARGLHAACGTLILPGALECVVDCTHQPYSIRNHETLSIYTPLSNRSRYVNNDRD